MKALGQHGPAGMIYAGMEFKPEERALLAESYKWLDKLLALLKVEDFDAWASLTKPYTGDPADPSIVEHWRKHGRVENIEARDRGIRRMAELADELDLDFWVAWPSRMSTRQEKQVEKMNDEFYRLYEQFLAENRETGMGKRKGAADAMQKACEMCGYSVRRGQEIVQVRRGEKAG